MYYLPFRMLGKCAYDVGFGGGHCDCSRARRSAFKNEVTVESVSFGLQGDIDTGLLFR